MAYLFASAPSSYAEEQASSHLSALSTLPAPTALSAQAQSSRRPSPKLEAALHELTASKPITRGKLVEVLQSLSSQESSPYAGAYAGTTGVAEEDKALEGEVMSRAVTAAWKEVLQAFVDGALEIEDERTWWSSAVNSRRGVGIYLVQTLPHRLLRAVSPHAKSFSLASLRSFHFPERSALFKPLPNASAALTSITSPYVLTRREMLSSIKALTQARDEAAWRVGVLASQGPRWSETGGSGSSGEGSGAGAGAAGARNEVDVGAETTRIYGVLCQVLGVPPIPPPTISRRSRSSTLVPPVTHSPIIANPSTLLAILTTHLPRTRRDIDQTLRTHRRPSPLTRFWFPLLFLPPALLGTSRIFMRNKDWMAEQVRNAKETVRGFFVQWVWEPLEGIGRTLRGGGEGLGVAPTTVKSDQASLERMVLDLGRDYYHLSGPALEQLGEKVRNGDMEEVLRVYEQELKSPLKNALMGSLVRTLLIQVQKTKTDLSLSLLSLDHLLRSQQLTFAFVGVAPSVLVLYGLGGYFRGVWRGEKRGKGRRRRYFNGLRDVERLLITAPKHEQDMSDRDRGLLIVSVSGMRTWAAGLGGSHREPFLDDLRMVEDPELRRGDKLRVVERMWRCWGVDGRGRVA